jgi:hypothetical protein
MHIGPEYLKDGKQVQNTPVYTPIFILHEYQKKGSYKEIGKHLSPSQKSYSHIEYHEYGQWSK